MENYELRIKEIEETIEKLENEKRELEREHRGLYVANLYVHETDEVVIVLLGQMTAANARNWVEGIEEDWGVDPDDPFFEVSEEEWSRFKAYRDLNETIESMPSPIYNRTVAPYKDELESMECRLKEIRGELHKELPIVSSYMGDIGVRDADEI